MQPDPIRSISVVIPVFQEEANLSALCEQLWPVLEGLALDVEVIFVDDGSTDGSFAILRDRIADTRSGVRVISFRRNAGQTAAMQAGIDAATHDAIVPLDADLQNDPADIPRLLDKLSQGWDVVSGWRKQRMDAAVRRNFLSRLANRMISKVTGVALHDYGCSLKAYRASVVKGAFACTGRCTDSFPSTPPCKGPRSRSCPYATIREPQAKATTALIGSSR